jgi:Kef-type K+ transport system membrane component KefB
MTTVLFQLLVAYAAARLLGRLAARLGLPEVIGELLAGALLGPHLLDLIHESQFFEAFAELGVIFLLFEAGLEARVRELMAVRGPALRVGVIGVALPFAGGLLAALAFGEATSNALFVATAFVATSVGITIAVLRELGVQSRRSARIILAAAVLDDILGLIVLVVVKGVALGQSNPTEIVLIALEAIAFVSVVVVAGPPLATRLSRLVKRLSPGVVFDASLVLMLALSLLAEYVGLAAIVGAFLAGLLLGELEDYDPIQRRIEPLTAFFVPFFFVLMGTYLDFAAFRDPLIDAEIAVFSAVAVATKYAGGWLGTIREGGRIPREVGSGMVPRGEVGIVVAGIAYAAGVVTEDVYTAVISMVLVTTFIAPFLIRRTFVGRPHGSGTANDAAHTVEEGPAGT